jgi:hypothetical protein
MRGGSFVIIAVHSSRPTVWNTSSIRCGLLATIAIMALSTQATDVTLARAPVAGINIGQVTIEVVDGITTALGIAVPLCRAGDDVKAWDSYQVEHDHDYEVSWTNAWERAPPGVYLARLESGGTSAACKLVRAR